MQAAEYAHSIVYFCLHHHHHHHIYFRLPERHRLQTTSTVDEVLRCRSSFRSLLSRLIRRTLTQMRCRTVAVHRRWRGLYMGVDHALYMLSKALHVGRKTSHWLERSSCRFTLIIRIPSSGSQYFTSFNHLLCGFVTEGLLQKPLQLISALPLIGPASAVTSPRTRTPRDDDWRVFRPLLKIFEYAAKQVCKQLQCNKANTIASAPPLMGFIWHASRTNNLLCTITSDSECSALSFTTCSIFADDTPCFGCQQGSGYGARGAQPPPLPCSHIWAPCNSMSPPDWIYKVLFYA